MTFFLSFLPQNKKKSKGKEPMRMNEYKKKEEHENEIKEFIFPRDYAIWVDSKGHVCYIVLFV